MFNIEQIEKIAEFEGEDLVSLYLDVDRKEHSSVEINSMIKDLFKEIDIPEQSKKGLEVKTNEFIATCSPSTKSIAIFYSPAHWFCYAFPHEIENHVSVNSVFDLGPMLNLLSQARKVGVLLFDSEQARFLAIFLGHLEEHQHLEDRVIRRHKKGGWSKPRFERKINEEIKSHLKKTVDLLVKADKIYKFDELYIRSEAELESEFLALIPPALKNDIKGWFKIDMNASADEIVKLINEITEKEIEKEDTSEIEEISGRVEKDADRIYTIYGIDAVGKAMYDNKISKIFLNEDYLASGSYCHFCGYISEGEEYCPYDQIPNYRTKRIIPVLIDEAIKKKIEIKAYKNNPVLNKYNGVIGLLKE